MPQTGDPPINLRIQNVVSVAILVSVTIRQNHSNTAIVLHIGVIEA